MFRNRNSSHPKNQSTTYINLKKLLILKMAKLIRGWTTKIFGWTNKLPNHKPIDGKSDQKKIKQAIKWVAAEHGYLEKVSQDLEQLTADLERAEQILKTGNLMNLNKM